MTENFRFSGADEKPKRPDLTENEVRTVVEAGLTPEDFLEIISGQPLAEGTRALIFELPGPKQNFVAKVWKNSAHDSDRITTEGVTLRLLRMRNFRNTPRLMGYLKSAGIIFEEKIEGEPIKNFDSEVIDKLAVALADLHSIKLNSYGRPFSQRKKGTRLDYLHDSVNTLRDIYQSFSGLGEAPSLLQAMLDKIEEDVNGHREAFADKNFTIIHFDLNLGNILFSKDRGEIIIIDWEQASAGDNAMDIAKLFLKADFNSEQQSEFLAQYNNHSMTEDPYFSERLRVYGFFVLVNSILWRWRVLRDRPEQPSNEAEKKFYERVEKGLEKELKKIKDELSQ